MKLKNEMSEKIAAIRQNFRKDALKFLDERSGETVEEKLSQWIKEGANSKGILRHVESFLATGTTIEFEGKVKTALQRASHPERSEGLKDRGEKNNGTY